MKCSTRCPVPTDAPAPVLIYSPMPLASGKGNAVSARRIAGLLAQAGLPAEATDSPVVAGAGVLVVLNAWRSAAVALDFKRWHPSRPLIAVLTGTDIFPQFPSHPEVIATLNAADAIVAWHDESRAQLPAEFQTKAFTIYKSAPDLPDVPAGPRRLPEPALPVEVLVIGHLREVKDPFLAAAAVRLLPEGSRVRIIHAGEALSDDMAGRAAREMRENPRYSWIGGIPREELFDRLRRACLTVNSSLAEGGANAVIESMRCGVPVLASRIPGNTGLLGRDWPGLFDCGDAPALAALLGRCEREQGFYDDLVQRTHPLAQRFVPENERAGWMALLRELQNTKRNPHVSGPLALSVHLAGQTSSRIRP